MYTKIIKLDPENPNKAAIKEASNVLLKGGLVAFPTETVYGLGADYSNQKAVKNLYRVKQRPENKPFSLHIANIAQVDGFNCDIPPLGYKLMERFWPGPLTLVFKSNDETRVGFRMPRNKVALSLIVEVGRPLFVPSANLSDNPAPCSAERVFKELNGRIDMILDCGKTEICKESTVVDINDKGFQVLREGAITAKDIEAVTKKKNVLFVCTGNSCRSVMAKGLLEKMAKERGKDVKVFSAGIGVLNNIGASPEALDILKEEGIDVSSHRAKRVTPEVIRISDLVIVMEKFHEENVIKMMPSAKRRIYLLGEFLRREGGVLDIPDPIGKSRDGFKECFRLIKDSMQRLVELL